MRGLGSIPHQINPDQNKFNQGNKRKEGSARSVNFVFLVIIEKLE